MIRTWPYGLCGVLAACGRLHFDPIGDSALDATPRCDPSAPFTEIVPLPGDANLAGSYDDWFEPTSDELSATFYSDRIGGIRDIFAVTRADTSSPWGSPSPVTALNGTSDDYDPSLSVGGSVIVFASSRGTSPDLWLAFADGASFGTPQLVTALDTSSQELHAFFQGDGQRFWFASDRDAGHFTIFEAAWHGGGMFDTPIEHAELVDPSATIDDAAVVSADGLTVYFHSDRPGGAGDLDIYVATRASIDQPFGGVRNVAELNSAARETPTWLSADRCRLYFASSRSDPSDIYLATRTP